MPEGKSHHIRAASYKHFIVLVVYRQHLFVSVCVFLSTKFDIKIHFILYKLIAFLGKNFSRKPSAGVPLTYYQNWGTAFESVEKLNNQFLSIPFSTTERDVFRKNGFLAFLSLNQIFENEYTIISGDKLQVRSMNFDDISKVTENYTASRQYVGAEKYNKLFALGTGEHYFIAFCDSDAGLHYVRSN